MTLSPTLVCGSPALAIPAFPGAEGFGANSTGGRGANGEVFHVTSLADTNTGAYSASGFKGGTLRYCIQFNGSAAPRTIVFDVGGTIRLTSNVSIKRPNMTVAGQTAPGMGITFTDYTFEVSSSSGGSFATVSNVTVRHLRSRKGNLQNSDDAMGVLGAGLTRDVILDHVSASWSEDEALSLTNNSTLVTVQNSFINEGLNGSGHGYASLIRPRIDASYSYHHNLVAHHKSRMPRPGSYDGHTTQLDFRNNVLYNWLDGPGYSEDVSPGEHVRMNYVGNFGIAGPSTPSNRVNRLFDGGGLNTWIWQSGNLLDSNQDTTRNFNPVGWTAFINLYTQMSGAFDLAAVTTDSAEVAYEKVLLRGGAYPWARDASDLRVVNDVRTQDSAGLIKNDPPADEWNAIITAPQFARPGDWDIDNDGMPAWWELGHGSNPAVADHNVVTPSGYSQLENYINFLCNTSAWGDAATGNWSSHSNWGGGAPNSIDALASFRSIASGPITSKTITVDQPQMVGMINFESPFVEYTVVGPAGIILDDSAGTAAINLIDGVHHTISAPLMFMDNTSVVVMPAASTLTLDGTIFAPAVMITKQGPGTVNVAPIAAGALSVNAGKFKFIAQGAGASATASVVGALSIAGSPASPTAVVDLTDNPLVIDYDGASPLNDVRLRMIAGHAGGSWTGNGITSSTAAANPGFALGLAEASAVFSAFPAAFGGLTIGDTSVLIAYTRYGDADLNSVVNLSDFNRLAANFGGSNKLWSDGDFNFDGLVNLADFNLLAANFGLTASANGPTPEDWSALASVVPEPNQFGFAGVAASAAILPRRRRSR